MNLTRRDLLFGAAAGLASGAVSEASLAAGGGSPPGDGTDPSLDATEVATVVALADVVYPSAVDVESGFIEGYFATLGGRRIEGARRAVADLDAAARSVYGARFGVLSSRERTTLLRELGVDTVYPRPDGTVPARIRYHLVNGLLYALFTSPVGTQLFGIRNPIGYPGGYYGSDRGESG